jgi:hypothetical protein
VFGSDKVVIGVGTDGGRQIKWEQMYQKRFRHGHMPPTPMPLNRFVNIEGEFILFSHF